MPSWFELFELGFFACVSVEIKLMVEAVYSIVFNWDEKKFNPRIKNKSYDLPPFILLIAIFTQI